MNSHLWRVVMAMALTAGWGWGQSSTTVRSAADGTVPVAMKSGAPAGSYALSGFEQVNVFSGHLNLSIPLMDIGGRGDVRFRMMAAIDAPKWVVETGTQVEDRNQTGILEYLHSTASAHESWSTYSAGYGPGVLVMKKTGEREGQCGTGQPIRFSTTFTYLAFLQPDGTELALYDTLTGGSPQILTAGCSYNPDRGTTFASRDGSGATFVASIPPGFTTASLYDDPVPANYPNAAESLFVYGDLYLADGTKYKIEKGLVTQIRDRNGNLISFSYYANTTKVWQITDAAGRVTTITYEVRTTGLGTEDEISFTGAGGVARKLVVTRAFPGTRLRPGLTQPNSLYPELGAAILAPSQRVVRIVLPDARRYDFYYTPWGEVARVDLPTGGRIEYDHGAGLDRAGLVAGVYTSGQVLDPLPTGSADWKVTLAGESVGPPSWQAYIYRRLLSRREYPDGGVTAALTVDHKRLETANSSSVWPGSTRVAGVSISATQFVEVERSGAGLTPAVVTRHYFHTEAKGKATIAATAMGPAADLLVSGPRYTPDPFQGKEYKSETVGFSTSERVYGLEGNGAGLLCQENSTLAGGVASGRILLYDRDAEGAYLTANLYGNLTDLYEYDFGSTPAIQIANDGASNYFACPSTPTVTSPYARRRHLDYVRVAGYTEAPVHLRQLVSLDQTYRPDTANLPDVAVTQTRTTYDNLTESGCTYYTSLVSSGSTLQQDASYAFGQPKNERGNPRCVGRWISYSYWSLLQTQFDSMGNAKLKRDTLGRITTFTYTDAWVNGTSPSQSAAQVTKITNALNHDTQFSYDYSSGKVWSVTDPNTKVTSYRYDDALDRLTRVTLPVGQREFVYDDASRKTVARERLSGSAWMEDEAEYDGFGRVVKQSAKDGAETVFVETRYNALGRAREVSNPYRAGDTVRWTVTSLDGLGRPTEVKHPDEAVDRICYAGAETVERDAADKWTRRVVDGLGRLVTVNEDATGSCQGYTHSGSHTPTSYRYDAADQLLGACQKGTYNAAGTCTGTGSRARTFTYNGMGLLRTANNPESGTTTLNWDFHGNLSSRVTANTVTTTYGYDWLHRLTGRTYSDGTPAVTQTWDAPCGKGFLCKVANGVSETSYGRNPMGWVTTSTQVTGGVSYPFVYEHNDAGGLLTMQYPSGRVVSYGRDGRNRASSVGSGTKVYGDQIQYAAHGALSGMRQAGGARWERWCYNERLQAAGMRVGPVQTTVGVCGPQTGDALALAYGYGGAANNGNVMTQLIMPLNQTQVYSYDGVNRLTGVEEGALRRSYGYDDYGNQWVKPALADTSLEWAPSSFTPVGAANFNAKNQLLLQGSVYTPGGLQTQIGGYTQGYDGETRLKTSTLGGVATTYSYDGEGRRVVRQVGTAGPVTMVYEAGGLLAAEYGGPAEVGTQYVVVDALGSTRAVFGGVFKRMDYLPFGEEIGAATNGRSGAEYSAGSAVRQRFTGKERDSETGLDYFGARYMSSAQGRFTSPDKPFADQTALDPQSWNLYSYTRNNPLKYVDRTGEAIETAWDAFSLGLGAASFVQNVRAGNFVSAAIDAVGVVLDAAAVATPFVPGGVGAGIKAARLAGRADDVMDAAQGLNRIDGAADAAGAANKGPSFLVSEGGDVIPVPTGATGPSSVVNPKGKTSGFSFTGGKGGQGLHPNVSGVRVMDSTSQYPSGYVVYQNAGKPRPQGVNPQTGRTVPNADPSRHLPLSPPKRQPPPPPKPKCSAGGSGCQQ